MPNRNSQFFSVRLDAFPDSDSTVGQILLDIDPARYIVAEEAGKNADNPHYHIWLEFDVALDEALLRRKLLPILKGSYPEIAKSDWALSVFGEDETSIKKGRSYHCKENVSSYGGFTEDEIAAFRKQSEVYKSHRKFGGIGNPKGVTDNRPSQANVLYDILSGTIPGWFDLYTTMPEDRRAIAVAIRRHYHRSGRTQPSSYYVRNLVNTYWLSIGAERGEEVLEKMLDFLASEDVKCT